MYSSVPRWFRCCIKKLQGKTKPETGRQGQKRDKNVLCKQSICVYVHIFWSGFFAFRFSTHIAIRILKYEEIIDTEKQECGLLQAYTAQVTIPIYIYCVLTHYRLGLLCHVLYTCGLQQGFKLVAFFFFLKSLAC